MALDLTLIDENGNAISYVPFTFTTFEELQNASKKFADFSNVFDDYYKDLIFSKERVQVLVDFLQFSREFCSSQSRLVLDVAIELCSSAIKKGFSVHFLAD